MNCKGSFQKLLNGFFPLRGGGGYPPFPLRVFGQYDFPLRGGRGGVPPNCCCLKMLLKSRHFRSKNTIFCLFSYLFSPFRSIIWPFWSFFNLILYKNIILVLLGIFFPEKLSRLSVDGGGGTPIFAKGFLEK